VRLISNSHGQNRAIRSTRPFPDLRKPRDPYSPHEHDEDDDEDDDESMWGRLTRLFLSRCGKTPLPLPLMMMHAGLPNVMAMQAPLHSPFMPHLPLLAAPLNPTSDDHDQHDQHDSSSLSLSPRSRGSGGVDVGASSSSQPPQSTKPFSMPWRRGGDGAIDVAPRHVAYYEVRRFS
jgi:hypothetical protein